MRSRSALAWACAAIALAALFACVAGSFLQLRERSAIAQTDPAPIPAEDSTIDGSESGPAVSTHDDLLRLIPVRIEGFRTSARHDVPGFEGEIAEGIFIPLDEELSVRTPLNSYVAARALDESTIDDHFEQSARRYDEVVDPPDLGPRVERAFAARDRGSYVIGWVHGGVFYLVDTRFTAATPFASDELLSTYGTLVATAVVRGGTEE